MCVYYNIYVGAHVFMDMDVFAYYINNMLRKGVESQYKEKSTNWIKF